MELRISLTKIIKSLSLYIYGLLGVNEPTDFIVPCKDWKTTDNICPLINMHMHMSIDNCTETRMEKNECRWTEEFGSSLTAVLHVIQIKLGDEEELQNVLYWMKHQVDSARNVQKSGLDGNLVWFCFLCIQFNISRSQDPTDNTSSVVLFHENGFNSFEEELGNRSQSNSKHWTVYGFPWFAAHEIHNPIWRTSKVTCHQIM